MEQKGHETRKKKERSEKKKKERQRTGRDGNARVRGLSYVEGRGRGCDDKHKCDRDIFFTIQALLSWPVVNTCFITHEKSFRLFSTLIKRGEPSPTRPNGFFF